MLSAAARANQNPPIGGADQSKLPTQIPPQQQNQQQQQMLLAAQQKQQQQQQMPPGWAFHPQQQHPNMRHPMNQPMGMMPVRGPGGQMMHGQMPHGVVAPTGQQPREKSPIQMVSTCTYFS